MQSEEKDIEAVPVNEEAGEVKTRKERMTGSTHFGDTDFYEESPEEIGDATWGEVCSACCCHTPKEWGIIFCGLVLLCFFLYFFLLGLELLGSAAKVVGGCTAGSILGGETNPIAALMIGILATVLLQSSSTTTSIIVSLVGAGSIEVRQAIYMIMGANIGTSVTNTIVAMGHLGNGDELERAFAGATVHDMFNFLSVLILLPLEWATGYLYRLTKAMLPDQAFEKGDKWEGPIKKIVSPLGNRIIKANKDLIKEISVSDGKLTCDDYYPVNCTGGIESYETCKGNYGLIACDKKTGLCPAFFQNGASAHDDQVSGGVCLVLALFILIVCLIGLVTLLQKMLLGTSTRIIYKATNINGYLAMVIGCGITILVQSSSITTSTLTPLVGMGVIQLEQMYPLTLGANIGTTFTAIMAALVSDKITAMQTALAHLFFNISGILLWYPIPFMRRVPLNLARKLGKTTRIWRGFPIVYIIVMFFIVPLILLGVSACFEQGSKGFTVLGSFLVVGIIVGIAYFLFWWYKRDGNAKCVACMSERQRRKDHAKQLPDNMEYIKAELERLREHTGLAEEADEENAKGTDTDDDDE
jgi:sodium-dependent phosphate cotransporter